MDCESNPPLPAKKNPVEREMVLRGGSFSGCFFAIAVSGAVFPIKKCRPQVGTISHLWKDQIARRSLERRIARSMMICDFLCI